MSVQRAPLVFSLLLLSALAMPALPASAAVSVFGNDDAVACYEAAEGRRGYVAGERLCDAALAGGPLSRPQRAATHVNRGIVRMHLQRGEEALGDYQAALGIDPMLGEAWVNRGIAKWHTNRDAVGALADLDKGIAIGTADADVAYFVRGIVHEHLGHVRSAYEDYSRAAALSPAWDAPRRELARFEVRN